MLFLRAGFFKMNVSIYTRNDDNAAYFIGQWRPSSRCSYIGSVLLNDPGAVRGAGPAPFHDATRVILFISRSVCPEQ